MNKLLVTVLFVLVATLGQTQSISDLYQEILNLKSCMNCDKTPTSYDSPVVIAHPDSCVYYQYDTKKEIYEETITLYTVKVAVMRSMKEYFAPGLIEEAYESHSVFRTRYFTSLQEAEAEKQRLVDMGYCKAYVKKKIVSLGFVPIFVNKE